MEKDISIKIDAETKAMLDKLKIQEGISNKFAIKRAVKETYKKIIK